MRCGSVTCFAADATPFFSCFSPSQVHYYDSMNDTDERWVDGIMRWIRDEAKVSDVSPRHPHFLAL